MKFKKQNLSVLVPMFIALGTVNQSNAQSYSDPNITDVSVALSVVEPISPNIFLLLDDSGSMSWNSQNTGIPAYDPNVTYRIPPDPANFNTTAGRFNPYGLPDGQRNGFQQNGIAIAQPAGTGSNARPSPNCNINDSDSSISRNCRIYNSFYTTRMLILKSSLAIALNNEPGKYNLDFDFINNGTTDGLNLLHMDRSFPSYQVRMRAFLRSLYREDPIGGTPFPRETVKIYNAIRNAATTTTASNLFLPDEATVYNENELLTCKQNVVIHLSDGAYQFGGMAASRPNSRVDYDGSNLAAKTYKVSDGLNGSIDLPGVNFRGDRTVQNQRLIAGGTPSLGQNGWSTMSDMAFQAWEQDLNTNIVDNVKPNFRSAGNRTITSGSNSVIIPEIWNPQNDPANWQRVVTYTIGMGLGSPWSNNTMYNMITNSNYNYQTGIDDFVRAGYVGRGGFDRVNTATELENTFARIFNETIDKDPAASVSATASNTNQVTKKNASIVFTATADTKSRTGDIDGHWLYSGVVADKSSTTYDDRNEPGGVKHCYDGTIPGTSPNVTLPPSGAYRGQLCTKAGAQWHASESIPKWQDRKVYTYNGSDGVEFSSANLTPIQRDEFDSILNPTFVGSLPAGNTGVKNLIEFIKGSNEFVSNDDIRTRPENKYDSNLPVLGDFGRGGPTYLGAPNKHAWGPLWDSMSSSTKNNYKKRSVAFAGANDGMLHAFDGKTGKELFAYIPNMVFGKLKNLIIPNSNHTAYVDGSIAAVDIVADGEPKTILVSGLGAGGKGLFALDVTNPEDFDSTNILWELDETKDKRIGKIFGKPSVIRVEGNYKGTLESGTALPNRWVVIVGTGYGNNTDSNEQSGILVIDAMSGNVIDFLELPGSQGVAEITWLDHQIEKDTLTFSKLLGQDSLWGEYDRGYVGDLHGNLWVLDFAYDKANSSVTRLKPALLAAGSNSLGRLDSFVKGPVPSDIPASAAAPLFIATDENGVRQPITSRPLVLPHPTNSGYLVYFGTGELFESKPFLPGTKNSMYSVWDDIGLNYGDLTATADVIDNNLTRDRTYFTHYKWKQIIGEFAKSDSSSATTSAYIRVPEPYKPMKWANYLGEGDSSSQNSVDSITRTAPASGWVINTGQNSTGQYERSFLGSYFQRNAQSEEGVTFLLNTADSDIDPCDVKSTIHTWPMSFRSDIIDGPFSVFSAPMIDADGDGEIDNVKDKVVSGGSTIVPIGAVSVEDGSEGNGVAKLLTVPAIIEARNTDSFGGDPDGNASNMCSGTNIVQIGSTNSSNEGDVKKQVRACAPRTLSSWSEVE